VRTGTKRQPGQNDDRPSFAGGSTLESVGAVHYLSAFAELEVADLDASVDWYGRVLGFRPIASVGDGAVHVRRAEGQDLVLVASDGSAAAGGVTLNLAIDTDLAGMAAGARSEGVDADFRPEHDATPEALELTDPDGHRLRVFARQVPTARVPG
jgi:catechol 2,3-dioxygenase-like lactoylglutathione lyase family enzyme